VERRALSARLAGAARVTLLSAPAGSGKTFLLRSWSKAPSVTQYAACITVPRDTRDAKLFLPSVIEALRGTAAGAKCVRPLNAASELDGRARLEQLLQDLRAMQERVWLIIDDLQELRSDEALRQLELLLMLAPPTLRIILASRHDMPLGLHRLRLTGDLTEIRTADLSFTVEESRALFAASGVTLSEGSLELLHQRTEGWAAGLRLAACAALTHSNPERMAASFCGSEPMTAEYLYAEVLDGQPEEIRHLLRCTSLLEQVNGALADHLTGSLGGERMLRTLERANAFVFSLDAERSWFRYHPLLADLLRFELRQSNPAELTRLHAAAAEWYAAHDAQILEFPIVGGRFSRTASSGALIEPLSESESRVLRYLPTNLSRSEIAAELYLSVNTVKTHMCRLFAKLGAHSRTELVERARKLGLLASKPRLPCSKQPTFTSTVVAPTGRFTVDRGRRVSGAGSTGLMLQR
jgi:LuxR family maltose regulon positive regulatory protein